MRNKKAKIILVIQAFCPLAILLFIQHFGRFIFTPIQVFKDETMYQYRCDEIICVIAFLYFIACILFSCSFKIFDSSGFTSMGNQITVIDNDTEYGLTFLLTYILPLLSNNTDSLKNCAFFVAVLVFVILLLIQSNSFYKNPVLALLGYHVFTFKFDDKEVDKCGNRIMVGIAKENPFELNKAIRWKHISNNVFLILSE